MRRLFAWIVIVLYCCPPMLAADYQRAEVVSMKTVSCDKVHALDPAGTSVVNAFFSGAAQRPDNEACTAYELRTSKVVYHVMTEKNLILPVGEIVHIRLTSREMSVHLDDREKDLRALILDMSLVNRSDAKPEEPPAPRPTPVETVRRESAPQPSARTCLSNAGDVVPCRED
jgi:hypothetical protein